MINLNKEQAMVKKYLYHRLFNKYKASVTADSGTMRDSYVLGPELAPNNITTISNWQGAVSQVNTAIKFYSADNWADAWCYQLYNLVTIGKKYKVRFNVISNTSSSWVRLGGAATQESFSGTGIKEFDIVVDKSHRDSTIGFTTGPGNELIIDNISIREITNSSVENYFKLCQQNNMYKSIEFAWMGEAGMKVSNGRISKLKTLKYNDGDILLNPSLSDSSKWLTAIGWSVSNNSAIATNSPGGNLVYQNKVLSIDSQYVISYEITSIVSGSVSGYINGNLGTPRTTPGKYYDIITPGIKNTYVGIITSSDVSSCIIKNISVKRYSTTDATQSDTNNQPYLSGNIAPNEKLCLKNPNGSSNYMTHPTISFGATDAWSVTFLYKSMGTASNHPLFGGPNNNLKIGYTSNQLQFFCQSPSINIMSPYINGYSGKTLLVTLVREGNYLKWYFDGKLVGTDTKENIILELNGIFSGVYSTGTGNIYSYIIRSQALTQAQITAEYNYLRSIYPEMESVQIGTQTWTTSNYEAVSTPMGTLIPEVQANGNVEKITNGGFDTDANWTKGAGWSIAGGVATHVGATSDSWIYQSNVVAGKWYKCTYTISRYVSGGVQFGLNSSKSSIRNAVGTYIDYLYSPATACGLNVASSFEGDIDNISVQEIGWAGSQELYDGIYAQTSGTAEEKTYAACKAAAMWCHYNNDLAIGAVYGKLYNWFAVKLLQMDIDKYNAANPTTPWGWRVPTQADFQTLSTYLGGDAVAGGKMKVNGTTYWNSPNIGADNSSGFSLLGGGGKRNSDGTYGVLYGFAREIGGNNYFVQPSDAILRYDSASSIRNIEGCSLRLIKA